MEVFVLTVKYVLSQFVHLENRRDFLKLFEQLDISLEKSELISIVGGGGKTTSMFRLGRELSAEGKKVLISTTTAIMKPEQDSYKELILTDDSDFVDFKVLEKLNSGIIVIGSKLIKDNTKLKGIDREVIDEIFKRDIFDYIIVEADGAKRKAIKAPDAHEPVIPILTTMVIGLIGLDVVYKKLYEEHVHRADIFAKITNSKLGDQIDDRVIFELIVSKNGIFKSSPSLSKKVVILNKAETKERNRVADKVRMRVEKSSVHIDKIIIGSMKGD